MDSCEKISNSITAAKELIENETRSLAALHKAKQLEKELHKSGKLFSYNERNYRNNLPGKIHRIQ